MELKMIEYFLQIVDKGGLSKAAESLYLTQPTMSRFLAKLEESAGVTLFHRKANSSLELTEAGKVYLEAARKINKIWRSMEAELENLKEQKTHHIRLGFDDDNMHGKIRAATAMLSEKYPHVTLESHYLNSQEIQAAILNGTVDIGFTSYHTLNDELSYSHLVEYEIDLVVNPSHALSKQDYRLPGKEAFRLKLSDLPADTPFLLMREGNVLRQCVDSYMQSANVTPYVPSTYFRQDLLEQILLENDNLVGFCPRSLRFRKLAYIALEPPVYHKRGFCFRKDKNLTPPEKLLIALLSGE